MRIRERERAGFALRVLIIAGLGWCGAAPVLAHDMHVVINEVNYHPYGNVDNHEFIELFNRGSESVDLSAWRFVAGVDFVFPQGTMLQPGAYLVVARNPGTIAALHGISNVIGPYSGKLANEGETLELVNSQGVLIERIHFDDADLWPTAADGEGPSLERASTQEAGDRPWNWAAARVIGGTPGAPNSVNTLVAPARDVVVNEVASSAGGGWIELYNRGSAAVPLDGYALVCEPQGGSVYTISGGASIAAGGYWSVNEAALPFTLPDDSELRVSLLTPDHRFIDSLNFRTRAADGSFGRWPDGGDDTYVMVTPTRDGPNQVALNNAVVINEIMYHPAPPAVGPGELPQPYDRNEEFVELYNRSAGTVVLTGWKLTGGINFDLPPDTQMAAGSFLVIARDPATIMAKYGLTEGVIGGFNEVLADGHERIVLRDALNNPADDVTYADDGGWPTEADGGGPSLELIHSDMENDAAVAWRASASNGGTPGAANSALVANPPPVILAVRHDPPAPTSAQPVTVTAKVSDADGVSSVLLWHVVDPATSFTSVAMADDGAHGDGAAGDGVYGATLPARPAGSIVRFYIEATDNSAHNIAAPVFPPTYARTSASDPTYLYQVDDRAWADNLPLYRVIMTAANLSTLRSRDLYSNVDLDGTFITGDTIIYNVGVRYRGQGSRNDTKKSFRVQFHDAQPWRGLEDLNLNAHNAHQQYLGQEFFSYVDLPVHRTQVVLMTLNNDLDRSQLADPNTYVQVESVNEAYLERVFVDDSTGNLYRADATGNLGYRDSNPDSYRTGYLKQTNEELDDYSDLVELTNILTNTPDEQFAEAVRAAVDIDEWMRYFAAMTVVTNDEGGICLDTGDDYYLYRRPSDQKWLMVPWDFDSVWDLSSSRSQPDQRLFRAGINDAGSITLPVVRRILRHPDFAPIYYREIRQMMAYSFHPDIMGDRLINLRKYSPRFASSDIDDIESFVTQRRAFLNASMPTALTVTLDEASRPRVDFIADGDEWRFFRGTAEPSATPLAWTLPGYVDTGWETGPSGIGYGDNDDRTTLSDMRYNYTSVYIRKTFTIDDLAAVPELMLGVWFDDGFVAYINGQEVARDNVSGTVGAAVPSTHTAAADHEASDFGWETYNLTSWLTAPNSPFVQGENTLAIHGLNKALDSSDFSLRPELYIPRVGPAPARITHIADGAQWSFFRGTTEPSAQALGWAQFDFAETGWETGPSGFGYGDNDDATVLSDMQDNYISVYIRRKFTLGDLSTLNDLTLDISYDDGFVAYINGQEVARASVNSTVGQPVAYDDELSVSDHEAAGFQAFDLSSLLTAPGSPLRAGENVLAIHGLNTNYTSSDFTLRPVLYSTGEPGSVVQDCGLGLVTAAETLHVLGVAPAGDTRWVRINGQTINYLPVSWDNNPLTLSTYEGQTPLQIGPNDVEIVALNADFVEVARRQLNIVRTVDTSTVVAGTLAAATTWTPQGGPYHVASDVIVPAGGVLTIQPGTNILFDADAALIVQGRLVAQGTAGAPIRFQPFGCGQTWPGIVFVQAQGESVLSYCEFFDAAAPTYLGVPYTAAVNVVGAAVRVEHARFERMSAGAIDASQGSALTVLDSICTDVAGGIHAEASFAQLERLSIQNVTSTAPAIALDGDVPAQSVVRACTLTTGGGDGLRLTGSAALIEGNTITGMAGTGLVLQGASLPTARGNVIASCATGVAVIDGATAAIDHCTVVGGQIGLDLYALNAGPGGQALVDSCIVWGASVAAIRLDANSSATVTRSDVAGGFAGTDNLDTDPLFVGAAAGNYYLAPNSPCVGTGTAGTDMGALPASANPMLGVVINEWMAKNTLFADPQGELDDWFELYNPGPQAVNIGGLYMSDHADEPGLWQIPANTMVPAKGFLLIWADRDVTDIPGIHADFAFDVAGEEIGLYLLAGGVFTPIDLVTFGPQTENISMGRTTDGASEIAALAQATPGWSNNPPPPVNNGDGLIIHAPVQFLTSGELPMRLELRTPWGEVDKDEWTGTIDLSTIPAGVITPTSVEVVNGMASGEFQIAATGPVLLTATYGNRQATVQLTGLDAPTYMDVSGTLPAGTTTWNPAGGIIRVTGDLTVPSGATLNIDAGTMVVLNGGVDITVNGGLHAQGTLAAPVLITATDANTPWGQILCSGGTASVSFNYTLLTHGGNSPNVGHTTSGPAIRGAGGATLAFADSSLIDEYGKGMYLSDCDLTLDRCLLSRMVMGMEIVNCDAAVADSFYIHMQPGGDTGDTDALYFNGGGNMSARRSVFAFGGDDGIDTLSSSPQIERCIVHGFEDKGISMYTGTIRIRDCLVFSNGGAGVSAKGDNTNVYVDNCTIYDAPIGIQSRDKFGEPNNIIHYFVSNTIVWAATLSVQTDYAPADITITNSILDPSVVWPGAGNSTADPRFRDPLSFDFRLRDDSPAINTGDAAFVPLVGEIDLDGRPRVLAGRVDRGAYEYAPVFGAGDYDGDGDVDLADFGHVQVCLNAASVAFICRDADLNHDGQVNADDLAVFAQCFSGPTVAADPNCAGQ